MGGMGRTGMKKTLLSFLSIQGTISPTRGRPARTLGERNKKMPAYGEVDENPFAVATPRRSIPWGIVRSLFFLGCCVGGVVGLHYASRQWLLHRLSENLQAHPPHVQIDRLTMLAELDNDGIPVIVEAIVQGDDDLSRAAHRTLLEMQGRWHTTAGKQGWTSLQRMLDSIARSAARSPMQRRRMLCDLLNDALRETAGSQSPEAAECYQQATELLAVLGTPSQLDTNAVPRVLRPQIDRGTIPEGGEIAIASEEPLPQRLVPLPARVAALRPEREEFVPSNGELERLFGTAGPPSGEPHADVSASGSSGTGDEVWKKTDGEGGREEPGFEGESPLAVYDTRSVMEMIGSVQPGLREHAIAELKRRGFTELDLEMSQRLISTDASVRLALIEDLVSQDTVDPRRWLLWLAGDAERDVRLAAISRLGTMDDPQIKVALRERLREERDPAVANRLRRFLGQSAGNELRLR